MWWIVPFVVTVALFAITKYHWSRRHLYRFASTLPGPIALPLLGNGIRFMGKPESLYGNLAKLLQEFQHPMRIWLGPKLLIAFSDPRHAEKALTSSKLLYKHEIYEFLAEYAGNGLISGSGPRWKIHRKLIQPIFNVNFVSNSMELFQKHGLKYIENLEKYAGKPSFDIIHHLHDCYADIISEAILGVQMRAQSGENKDFMKASDDFYNILFARMIKPWLHPDIMYNNSSYGPRKEKMKKAMHDFIRKAIKNVWLKMSRKDCDDTKEEILTSAIKQIADLIEENPGWMDDKEFVYHMLTLYAASEDTMATCAAFSCLCFGMYPEYQAKAVEEIRAIVGNTSRTLTYDDVNQLKYLEMCIKEVLRLFPIAPLILRRVTEEIQIDKWKLPVGCAVLLPIFLLHRNADQWQHPDEYFPDHFLPEAVKSRHSYSFLPFSAGPRGCIGKPFAYAGLKVILANILLRYVLEADGKVQDIPLRMDISVRPQNGYNVRIKNRVWE